MANKSFDTMVDEFGIYIKRAAKILEGLGVTLPPDLFPSEKPPGVVYSRYPRKSGEERFILVQLCGDEKLDGTVGVPVEFRGLPAAGGVGR